MCTLLSSPVIVACTALIRPNYPVWRPWNTPASDPTETKSAVLRTNKQSTVAGRRRRLGSAWSTSLRGASHTSRVLRTNPGSFVWPTPSSSNTIIVIFSLGSLRGANSSKQVLHRLQQGPCAIFALEGRVGGEGKTERPAFQRSP